MKIGKYMALDVAAYCIDYCNKMQYPLNCVKLGKKLYYAEAKSLCDNERGLFVDEIIHNISGPSIHAIDHVYGIYGFEQITQFMDTGVQISEEDKMLLKQVCDAYAYTEDFELINKTHREDPWKNSGMDEIISDDAIFEYYSENYAEILNEASSKKNEAV